jgi:predicted O-linked N-acetylglucosamine transferase (SPINDLY family)
MAQAIRHHGEARLDLRASLRERMRASALMDGAAFAEAMQSAHRQLWDMA